MSSWTASILTLLLAASSMACQTKYLVFTTYSKVGLDVGVSDGQPTSLMFGYKRYEGAVVPVDVCLKPASKGETPPAAGPPPVAAAAPAKPVFEDACGSEGGNEEPEAMSVYAAMEIDNSWLKGLEIIQLFATGKSAEHAANDPVAFSKLVRDAKKKEGEGE